ncbi:unnamed protein product, partial [Cyprideis torosa]
MVVDLGIGGGLILRSAGSAGGLDIIAVILNKYYNIGVGKFFMAFNCVLFAFVLAKYSADIFVASILLVFIASKALDFFLTFFNQRKVVYVISDHSQCIAQKVVAQDSQDSPAEGVVAPVKAEMMAPCPYGEEVFAKRQAFMTENRELRKQIAMKKAEIDALMHAESPDAQLVAKATGELFDLKTDMQAKAQEVGLPPRMGKGGTGDTTEVYFGHEYTGKNMEFAALMEPQNIAIQERAEGLRRQEMSTPSTLALEKETNPFLRCNSSSLVQSLQEREGKVLTDPLA